MSRGLDAHEAAESRLTEIARDEGCTAPVLSSAGALVHGLDVRGARRISLITPHVLELTEKVIEYVEHAGAEVGDVERLGVADNFDVGGGDPGDLPVIASRLTRSGRSTVVPMPVTS